MLSAELLTWLPAYLALGVAGGFAAGLLGIGGGMLYVPLLTWLFEAQGFASSTLLHLALGTSLTTIVFTSISSARTHNAKGNVDWSIVRGITPGILVGGVIGTALLIGHARRHGRMALLLDQGFLKFLFLLCGMPVMLGLVGWLVLARSLPWAWTCVFGEAFRESHIMQTHYTPEPSCMRLPIARRPDGAGLSELLVHP